MRYFVGIDTGTTSISIAVMIEAQELLDHYTINHNSFITSSIPEHKIQDPERIRNFVSDILDDIQNKYGIISGIGFTGQMHGILYINAHGDSVSPLYTWQDMCSTIPIDGTRSTLDIIHEHGMKCSAGYGLSTHYYLQKAGKIPDDAFRITTISDYIAMKLCGNNEPLLSPDMASSWGCFDTEHRRFMTGELTSAGVDISYLPKVTRGYEVIGSTVSGVPVVCSMGDNQAAVRGSVKDENNSVLVNIGTGSQVSFVTNEYADVSGDIELRPYGEKYVLAGAALCGGRAYAMLEKFYHELTGSDCYEFMAKSAKEFLDAHGLNEAWNVDTRFSGTRSDPTITGSITGITSLNFSTGALTAGVMRGILQELHGMYTSMKAITGRSANLLVGSGNGIRKNKLMQRLAEEIFGMKIYIPEYTEEAACGAAMCAM